MSFLRILPAVLGGGFLLLGLAHAQTAREPAAPKEKTAAREQRTAQGRAPAKPAHVCKLRLAWWEAPEEPPELAIMQDKDRIPVFPEAMSLGQPVSYQGDPRVVIVKKTITGEVDKAGKPVVQWLPYFTFTIGENDTDLAVLLFPDAKGGVAQSRVFDFSPETFPYGSVQLVNFTSLRIAVSIDGTSFVANSRGTARYPKTFDKATTARFFMAAEENGEQKLLRSSMMTFRPTGRALIFAIERPGATEDSRFHTAVIVDNQKAQPTTPEIPATAPKGKAKPTPAPAVSTKATGGALKP